MSARRGIVLVVVIVCLVVMSVISLGMARMFVARRLLQIAQERQLQAVELAESGLQRAVARLRADADFTTETWTVSAEQLQGKEAAVVEIRVASTADSPTKREIRVEVLLGDEAVGVIKHSRQASFNLTDSP